ncbi:hypothetical protein LL033_24515 (plasmid) [Clostridium estertheticum]|uniref:hypothetical protein n=1 Tax=Clostridium estertheticum TaxID=238834 RepID=UPI00227D017E|nr:hypothetical protein [Clostridium estertheticum]WAG58297.1 hypothetical protein LL033_24515 [Clostridium estertheticum]
MSNPGIVELSIGLALITGVATTVGLTRFVFFIVVDVALEHPTIESTKININMKYNFFLIAIHSFL